MTRFAWADDRSGSFATEIACPRRVRFYPDGGLNDETRARLVAACWRFAARSEAIHLATVRKNGLLRCARNDGLSAMAQHATLSVVIARRQVRATRGPMTGSAVSKTARASRDRPWIRRGRATAITERVPALPAVLRDDTPPTDCLRSTEAPAPPSGSDRTRMDTWCESGIRSE